MEAKHTPGPWTVHSKMRDCVTFEGRHGTENLFLQNLDGYFACQSEADARLIAAAPDLLAALQELHGIVQGAIDDGLPLGGHIDSFTLQPAREAIAKATS